MLRVCLPSEVRLRQVHRGRLVYVVPRTTGPQAGSALIGATVEDAGFDIGTHPRELAQLRALAASLDPALAWVRGAPLLEAWAGLRPCTPDELPLLGCVGESQQFVATGHFRNGILLAPGTAEVLADLLEGRKPRVSLEAFAPERLHEADTRPQLRRLDSIRTETLPHGSFDNRADLDDN
jgi:glycine oxidase